MSSNQATPHQTQFDGATSGIYSTGSGDVNVVVANLGEALAVIKRLMPKEQTNAVEWLIDGLRQLSGYQKVVNELKNVHNRLHDLEGALATIELLIQNADREAPGIATIEQSWRRAARPQIQSLIYFASKEMIMLQPQLNIGPNGCSGPPWAVQLVILQAEFELSARERNIATMCQLWMDMLQTCRDHLYMVDKQLLEAAGKLDLLSDQILRIIDDDANSK